MTLSAKQLQYNRLPMKESNKPLIALQVLMLGGENKHAFDPGKCLRGTQQTLTGILGGAFGFGVQSYLD
jgi:hypothetical protein